MTKLLLSSFTLFLLLVAPSLCLNLDGTLLLSFKYSILSDPFSVLENWDYTDETPCQWKGVRCAEVDNSPFGPPDMFRVVSLHLPNSQLMGSIPEELGFIPHLRNLDLSNNFLNGTLPDSLLNASELTSLSLSNNDISGGLLVKLQNLRLMNLSDNNLSGNLPSNLASLQNLNVVSLKGNQFYGSIPSGFHYVQVMDLSSNLLNGSLPSAFGGEALKYLNLSLNDLSGFVPPDFAKKIPANVIMDLSFNKLTGEIPDSMPLNNQKTESFKGNVDLCGKPLKKPCTVPSTLSIPPNISGTNSSSPAIAAIPQTIDSNSQGTSSTQNQAHSRLKLGKITGIVVGDLVGVAVLAIISLYVYQLKKKKVDAEKGNKAAAVTPPPLPPPPPPSADQIELHKSIAKESEISKGSNSPPRSITVWSCLNAITNGEETSDVTTSDSDEIPNDDDIENQLQSKNERPLIMVDGGTELELETLLKASAYILGSSNGTATIVYKAVLENGDSFAVRRIGESCVERFKEFENQIKSIAKLRHRNLLRIRGFYWREDEKLVIYDYISGGSLANAGYGKVGFSPHHLPFGTRIKIAREVAKGLAYIHEKKHVHGNIKPSNILLTPEMEPIISDLGLHKLLHGKHSSHKSDGSARHFGSRRCSAPLDNSINGSNTPYFSPAGFMGCTSPYHAPESLNNVKPNPKWDVYSFGIILLELLTGKVFSDRELSQWTAGLVQEDKGRVLRMADVAIRSDVASREDAMFECFKLGFRCASLASQKRPSMKDALGVLQKIQCS